MAKLIHSSLYVDYTFTCCHCKVLSALYNSAASIAQTCNARCSGL